LIARGPVALEAIGPLICDGQEVIELECEGIIGGESVPKGHEELNPLHVVLGGSCLQKEGIDVEGSRRRTVERFDGLDRRTCEEKNQTGSSTHSASR
jgi:hypothetical protein